MKEENIYEVLKIIINKINHKKIIWGLEGSANLLILGINLIVRDLDITTDEEGINVFRDILKSYVIQDFFNEKIGAKSLILKINNFEVEINYYLDKKFNFFDKIKIINFKDIKVPILPIENALEFYKLINRKDKIELLEKYLINKKIILSSRKQ